MTQVIQLLEKAIEGAELSMHGRDFDNARKGCTLLGRDITAEIRAAEFQALPEEEKADMEAKRFFGIYGVIGLYSADNNPEVPVALSLRKLEAIQEEMGLEAAQTAFQALPTNTRKKLTNEFLQSLVSARFPEMTPKRIQNIIHPSIA